MCFSSLLNEKLVFRVPYERYAIEKRTSFCAIVPQNEP